MDADPWKQQLSPEAYAVLREKATEPAWSGELLAEKRAGVFVCGACGQHLFASDTKFESGSGWPSFSDTIPGAVTLTPDNSHGMRRTEVTCSQCGSHLGHLFTGEKYDTPTDQRYCINSLSLKFTPKNDTINS